MKVSIRTNSNSLPQKASQLSLCSVQVGPLLLTFSFKTSSFENQAVHIGISWLLELNDALKNTDLQIQIECIYGNVF